MDYFALLQQPRQPWLDPEALKANFLRLSATAHPDKVLHDKDAATRCYAELNSAHHCLLEPKERLRHLLELESAAPPSDVQSIPPGTMELFMEIGEVCRGADQFLADKNKVTSPLLKVQMFQTGMAWTEKLTRLRERIDLKRDELLAELKNMNAAWQSAPAPGSPARVAALPLGRLEQLYRIFSYMARWTAQIQERIVQLSF